MIAFDRITKSFGTRCVLSEVSLELPKGQSLALIGRSGSGKSVIGRILLGLETPDAGRVLFDGDPLTPRGRRAFLSRCGVLFQHAALFESLPIWENVVFRALHGPRRQPRQTSRHRAIEALVEVGLDPQVAVARPSELSGGMRKRAALARAIVDRPDILILDEPNAGLDPLSAAEIDGLIRRILSDRAITALTITHDIASIRTIATRVALLEAGRIAWEGAPDDMATCDDATIRAFWRRSFP
ncbi:ABC transporter ATP-binding protein [Maritimibacter sp. DP1N21-5]|uniref:ABC transporter ATP-binding protein n=1 Tax=Maritimibacter sp. DP1N21-5 TaxID=2836867 RepID=UPI001C45D166|nr:ATP-binding cassette domain-containing protein [Maritimibacter sp. DP1N21-5]MBV7410015.1 ATP-binding cassette domain-containing protein [Maritimibacter sp. DP1N21-5]